MVRKIPAKKHRGVKDPLQQLARRNACPSINAAPCNPKDQEVPKSLLEIQRLCQLAKNYDKSGFKMKRYPHKNNASFDLIDTRNLFDKDPKLRGMRRKDKKVPRIVQKPGEDDDTFFRRFSAATKEFLYEVELENKHDVILNSDSKGSESSDGVADKSQSNKSSKKRKKSDFVDLTEDGNIDSSKEKGFKKPKLLNSSKDRGTKPNKRQRRKLRKAMIQKEEHHENEDLIPSDEEIDFTSFKDEVKFGEVAHRPPQFTAKPRGSELNSKPGTKDLLLKELINTPKQKEKTKKPPSKLSNAQKYFLEQERIRVVQAYRDLKANKVKR